MNTNQIPILYDFKEYKTPIDGVFEILDEEKEYDGVIRWPLTKITLKIIGECDDFFVDKIIYSEHGIWVNGVVEIKKFFLPLGIHKSRLVNWLPMQLKLF